MTNEQQIIEKLKRIGALFESTNMVGEKRAAALAMQRLSAKLQKTAEEEPTVEYKFCLQDMWSRKLFVALLRKYGITPYRYARQKYTTVLARVTKTFVDEVLWEEFKELNTVLQTYLEEVSDRLIKESVNADSTEVEVVSETKALMR